RGNITDLDLSNKNLEGPLLLSGFTSLKGADVSSNPNMTGFTMDADSILYCEELNYSHYFPRFPGHPESVAYMLQLKKLNVSNANLGAIKFYNPNLTYLDVSNNILKELDLS